MGTDSSGGFQNVLIENNKIYNTAISGIKDGNYYCTMSFGVNTIVQDSNTTPEQFLNSADKAMYEAKKTGKNRIVVSKS